MITTAATFATSLMCYVVVVVIVAIVPRTRQPSFVVYSKQAQVFPSASGKRLGSSNSSSACDS
jgi:hypothetical protein